jgi:hypothetical protein
MTAALENADYYRDVVCVKCGDTFAVDTRVPGNRGAKYCLACRTYGYDHHNNQHKRRPHYMPMWTVIHEPGDLFHPGVQFYDFEITMMRNAGDLIPGTIFDHAGRRVTWDGRKFEEANDR